MRTSIYLPDALAAEVKRYDISISEVTQTALRQAVDQAATKENLMSDMTAVIDRLRGTIDEADRQRHDEGHEDGVRWAKQYATAAELEYIVDQYDGSGGEFTGGHSLVRFIGTKESFHVLSVPVDLNEAYWDGFIDGAGEVWDHVKQHLP